MAQVIMELTNRCNLSCQHCYAERHAATGDLSLSIVDKVIEEGKACGIDHLCFTGGEPTIHGRFDEIVRRLCDAGYTFSFVSNGVNFPKVCPLLLRYRDQFKIAIFSLDGAREETHDRLRGKGSYRRVMRAASLCMVNRIPFAFNMVLTAQNRHEVAEMVHLAGRLGSTGMRFGHLMFSAETALRRLDLSPEERREVEAEIWRLRDTAEIPVLIAPGYFSKNPFFPCGPLELEEFNLDYRGRLTLCCHLSGYSGAADDTDIIGDLHEISLAEACDRFHRRVEEYLADKQAKISQGEFGELDHFPCWYCVKYLNKASWISGFPEHDWA